MDTEIPVVETGYRASSQVENIILTKFRIVTNRRKVGHIFKKGRLFYEDSCIENSLHLIKKLILSIKLQMLANVLLNRLPTQ